MTIRSSGGGCTRRIGSVSGLPGDAAVESPVDLAVLLASALSRAGVPYAIGGAIAYGFWGVPRGTKDLDINVFLPAERAHEALDALTAAGLEIDIARAQVSARERGDARGRVGEVPVDLFFDSIPFHESAARRTVETELLGTRIRILTAEDIVVLKLLYFRSKDIVDIERVIAVQGRQLDRG